MNTSADQAQAVLREASALASAGQQIQAIKLWRERFGVGLKEAKDLVDGLIAGRQPEIQTAFQLVDYQMPETPEAEVRRLMAAGNKIEAIKRVREQTGLGLKEAKERVEAMEAGQPLRLDPASPVAVPNPSRTDGMSWSEIERLARSGKKIEAIKLHREIFGTGLAEAKAAVEARLVSSYPQTQRPPQTEEPQTLAQGLGAPGLILIFGGGLLALVACAAVAVVALGLGMGG